MVFEDDRNDDQSALPYMHSSNSSIDGIYQVPASVEDPDYYGLELHIMVFCDKHGKASMRYVSFEGINTGSRFLACAERIADLLKGKEVHSEEMGQLELEIAELMKGEEELKMKLKCILAILQK
ncbi:hypothetical protein ZWY2020_043464 [Hordeum vulgare]|nr:hypothetical protein ZWY2020_043464 [Hordeum vulgare]